MTADAHAAAPAPTATPAPGTRTRRAARTERDPARATREVTIPKADLDREVYLAVAATAAPETDVVAGILHRLLLDRPDLPGPELAAAAESLAAAVAAHRPDPARDLAPSPEFRAGGILAATVPHLTDPVLRPAARAYSRAFLGSFRVGASPRRQVQPLDLQFDRLAGVQQLRRDVWHGLREAAVARPDVAAAIDAGPLGVALRVATTDSASEAVGKVDLPVLRALVQEHVQPDGSLRMPAGGVDDKLAQLCGDVSTVRDSYVVNLLEINVAISAAEKEKTPENQTALEKAVADAEKKQKELDELLEGVSGGTGSALGVLAALAEHADEGELAGDIREFARISVGMIEAVRTVASASIQVGKVVAGLASASASTLLLGGGIGFAFVMLALMIQVTGLFGKPRAKPITQVILEEVRKLSELVTDLRDELRGRFDRLDQRLDRMYAGILSRLAEIDFNVGQVEGDVEELQASFYDLHASLVRLTSDLQALLDAAHRRELVEVVNGALGFEARTGQPMDAATFFDAENRLYSWAHDHAKDALQAGPEARDFTDDALLRELAAFPLSTNVNYLSRVPDEVLGLAPLASGRLANPVDWVVAAEAYCQLCEESPALAAQVAPGRVQDLVDVGEALADALARIADPALVAGLAHHYRTQLDTLLALLGSVETEFRGTPRTQLHGIDLWGGAEQQPVAHFLTTSWAELGRCGGGAFDAATRMVTTAVLGDLDTAALLPFLVADNLSRSQLPGVAEGLAQLGACVGASWRTVEVEDLGLGGRVRVTYDLTITVDVRYGTDVVFRYTVLTPERFVALVRRSELDSFDPATGPGGKDPYPLLVGDTQLWAKVPTFERRQGVTSPALRAAAVAAVERSLRAAQRAFYAEVADRLVQAGDAVSTVGRRLTGSRALWRALALSGFPLSMQANEILRGLLLGSGALLAGADEDADDTSLDDVRDLYGYFGARAEDPPPVNILGDVRALAEDRLTRLTELLDGVLAAGDPPEPPQVLAPTLLRLSLLRG